jgi:hypothetical protein
VGFFTIRKWDIIVVNYGSVASLEGLKSKRDWTSDTRAWLPIPQTPCEFPKFWGPQWIGTAVLGSSETFGLIQMRLVVSIMDCGNPQYIG